MREEREALKKNDSRSFKRGKEQSRCVKDSWGCHSDYSLVSQEEH